METAILSRKKFRVQQLPGKASTIGRLFESAVSIVVGVGSIVEVGVEEIGSIVEVGIVVSGF